jgi:hypothetical protein
MNGLVSRVIVIVIVIDTVDSDDSGRSAARTYHLTSANRRASFYNFHRCQGLSAAWFITAAINPVCWQRVVENDVIA